MRGFLLDTNIISELRRHRPAPRVTTFVAAQPEKLLYISEVTFAEIRFGVAQLDDASRRAELTSWIDRELRPLFEDRTLPVSEDVILRWRLLLDEGRQRGHTFGQPDLFIAAIAAEERLIVVTRDITHFVTANVPVLDPWAARLFDRTGRDHLIGDLGQPDLLDELVSRL